MKKTLIALSLGISTSAFAMTTVNLDNANYMCNGTKITSKTTVSQITMNCKNAKVIMHQEPTGGMYANREPGGGAAMTMTAPSSDDEDTLDKVEFYSDKGTYLKCYFNNNTFVKCKAKPAKKPNVAASQTIANSKSSSSTPVASMAK